LKTPLPRDVHITQALILKSASKQLACRGIGGLTLRRVAKEAGLTRGALQYHYSQKKNLVDATYRHVTETSLQLLAQRSEQFADKVTTGRMLIDFVCQTIVESVQSRQNRIARLEMEWEARLDPALRTYVQRHYEANIRFWSGILTKFNDAEFWAMAITEFVDATTSLYLACGMQPWVALVVRDDVTLFLQPFLRAQGEDPAPASPVWFGRYCDWIHATEEASKPGHDRNPTPATPLRERIVQTAMHILCDGGLSALTHRRLAEDAGVSLASTTYYFRNKQEILQEVFRSMTAETRQNAKATKAIDGGLRLSFTEFMDLVLNHALDTSQEPGRRVLIIKRLHLEAMRIPQLQPLVLPSRLSDAEVLFSLLKLVPGVRETITPHAAYVWSLWLGAVIALAQARLGDTEPPAHVRARLREFSPVFFGMEETPSHPCTP
jgi:AcrR family transcriptional regulator